MKSSITVDILFAILLLDVVFSFCLLGQHESNLKHSTSRFCVRNIATFTDSANNDLDDETNVVDNSRLTELERRRKKEQICKSMPRSQKWFKAKQQHVSPNQKRIFNEYWPIYGINLKYGTKVVPHELFPNISASFATPVVLDIGFGTGDSIVGMSQQNKNKIYLGCEIHRAGISITLGNITTLGIENVKLVRADVTMLLETYLTDRCLDEVCIYFPDPWVNFERDGGRRVVRKDIIQMLSDRMRPGGLLHIATDVQDYADHVRAVMDSSPGWKLNTVIEHLPCVDGPSYRPVTRYEKKAIELSNKIWDFEYVFDMPEYSP